MERWSPRRCARTRARYSLLGISKTGPSEQSEEKANSSMRWYRRAWSEPSLKVAPGVCSRSTTASSPSLATTFQEWYACAPRTFLPVASVARRPHRSASALKRSARSRAPPVRSCARGITREPCCSINACASGAKSIFSYSSYPITPPIASLTNLASADTAEPVPSAAGDNAVRACSTRALNSASASRTRSTVGAFGVTGSSASARRSDRGTSLVTA
mmetsp:Transcript_6179/g.13456  ORF Transcript_6179/g.13456 Transcript_6179/m.13456 type:complete len:217 (+) Transcript_6179:415-1065(+)